MAGEEAESTVIEIRVTGNDEDAGDILASLVMRGAQISRFERSQLGLADLIERAIRARSGRDV
jgi:hypothetical protein